LPDKGLPDLSAAAGKARNESPAGLPSEPGRGVDVGGDL